MGGEEFSFPHRFTSKEQFHEKGEVAGIMRKKHLSKRQLGYLLALPALLLIFCVFVYPLTYAVYISFFNMNITKAWKGPEFVGLDNFIVQLSNPGIWRALLTTSYFVITMIFVGMPISFGIALLLDQKFKFRSVVRASILIPWIITPVIKGLMWNWIFNADYGFLNGALYQLGLISDYIAWLAKPRLALVMVILANVWEGIPFTALLYLAGLQSIPQQLYEAAKIDGATAWQSLTKITLPLLTPITLILIVLNTLWTFKLFDLVYVLTKGGPANTTQVITYYIFTQSFKFLHIGKGAALAFVLALMMLALVYVYQKLIRVR